jgi:tyrosine ammonia-lyase
MPSTLDSTSLPDTVVVELSPDTPLSPQALERAVTARASAASAASSISSSASAPQLSVRLSDAALARLQSAERVFTRLAEQAHQNRTPIYGVTTGFGPLVRYTNFDDSADDSASNDERRARGLLEHLSAGYGAFVQPEVVRAAMLLRLQTLVLGHSGVRLHVVRAYARLLERSVALGVVPAVPEIGSLGASGDLMPLAHVARFLAGTGDCVAVSTAAREYLHERLQT